MHRRRLLRRVILAIGWPLGLGIGLWQGLSGHGPWPTLGESLFVLLLTETLATLWVRDSSRTVRQDPPSLKPEGVDDITTIRLPRRPTASPWDGEYLELSGSQHQPRPDSAAGE